MSQSALDEARTSLEQAENRQRAAAGQLVIARARVAEANANVAQARAAVERAEEELANATIKAPIRATVLTRDVEVGSPVSSILNLGANATLVMTLGDIERVFVRGRVDEADIGQVRLGQAAKITTETFRDRIFNGRVTQISPIGVERDNVTTFEVEVSIDNPGRELKANMTANAEIILEQLASSLLLPEAAVTYDNARNASVDVADPGARTGRRRVPVKVGVGNGTRIQVLERRQGRRQGRPPGLEADVSAEPDESAWIQMREVFAQVFSNLRANKLRSFLTMFGILWGVISVVVLSATGEGFQRGNQHVLEELGKNVGIVWGGRTSMQAGGERAGRRVFLTVDDARALAQESSMIAVVSAELQRGGDPGKERLQRRRADGARHRAAVPGHPHDRHRARAPCSGSATRRRRTASRSSAPTPPRSCSARATASARRSS